MSEAGIELVVRSAEKRDAGRGIARLPEAARKRLGVLSGDTVVIEGARETVAKLWPARAGTPDDAVLVDAGTRANAGVGVGDTVRVCPVDVEDAEAVTLTAPPGVDADADTARRELRRTLESRPIRTGDAVRVESVAAAPFVVTETDPEGVVRVTGGTDVELAADPDEDGDGDGDGDVTDRPDDRGDERSTTATATSSTTTAGVTYEDIGGLDDELDLVRETVELPLAEPELFDRLGVDPPKGVLLHGPPGTGKTLIARAVANEVDATFLSISGPEIVSKYKGDSEERLREVFEHARTEAPSIVFFDEIDSVAPKREEGSGMEDRIVGQLLSLMDGLEGRGEVVVIGATNRVDDLDPALRRGGRFDREIEVGVPGEAGRREILEVHTRRMPLEDVDLDRLAARTHGFVGADLESLAKEAAMSALRRARREDVPPAELRVTRADFESAVASVDPSAMREYVAETPTEGFDSVGGLDDAKATLERAVTWPLTYGPLFDAADADPPAGVLLYGPPGTGKTLLARAVAAESGVNFIRVQGPELLDRYVGESEKAVREVFDRARQTAPTVVFFDEIDAVATDRDRTGDDATERVVSQLLTEFDAAAANPSLMVLAATNRKDALDPALLRPGRLEQHVEVPAPDEAARRAILDVHTRDKPLGADVDLDALARRTQGYSGADLAAVCREAAMAAVADVAAAYPGEEANAHADEVCLDAAHFDAALNAVEPSLPGPTD